MEQRKVIIKKKNRLLEITRFTIPYIKELKQLPSIKSTNACILMQQIEYWFAIKPKGFYKFLAPPNSIQYAYKKGDSWTEELTISEDEYRTAFDQIGVRYSSKKEFKKAKADDVFQGKYYCSYFDKVSRLTHYFRNHEKVEEAIDFIENLHQRDVNSNLTESTVPIPRNEEYQFIEDEFVYPESTNTTSNITIVGSERELSDDNKSSHITNQESENEKKENNQSEDVNEKVLALYGNEESSHIISGFNLGEKILIPLNFAPTLDKQFCAIVDFPDKSSGYVTEKFIRHYREKDMQLTLFQWNNKWWDWMVTEPIHRFFSPDKIESEQNVIYNKVRNKIASVPELLNLKVISHQTYLDKLKGYFSKRTTEYCLATLVEDEYFGKVGDYYFYLENYRQSTEWKGIVDEELTKLGLTFG